jgi:hypothetical protein
MRAQEREGSEECSFNEIEIPKCIQIPEAEVNYGSLVFVTATRRTWRGIQAVRPL